MAKSKLLTKSKYLLGMQCPKLLWTAVNEPEKMPKVDAATQQRFDEGTMIGELAQKRYPDGIVISADDFMGNIWKTQDLLKERKPLFEAGFMVDRLFSRGDILVPADDEAWDIIEVKSGTKVKDVNLHDVSFQKYCYERCGLKINRCYLMHINNQYVRDGEIDVEGFFTADDITDEVDVLMVGIRDRISKMKLIMNGDIPIKEIGDQCNKPYDCALISICWAGLPKENVFELYRGGKKSFSLYGMGVKQIEDIPDDVALTSNQETQRICARTGEPFINKDAIVQFLEKFEYPLYYLDFETFNSAVPMYDGVRPYQQVPFQFSLHIVKSEGAEPVHISFLDSGNGDPRKRFLEALKNSLGETGTIVAYNDAFEKRVITELARVYPEDFEWSEGINSRFIDLLIPFRNFFYYNPLQKGSASIKKVLPALTGRGYSDMEISQGDMASREFLRTTDPELSAEEVATIRKNLEDYCALDTEAMILLHDKLKELVE